MFSLLHLILVSLTIQMFSVFFLVLIKLKDFLKVPLKGLMAHLLQINIFCLFSLLKPLTLTFRDIRMLFNVEHQVIQLFYV